MTNRGALTIRSNGQAASCAVRLPLPFVVMFLEASSPLMMLRLLILVCLLAGNAHAEWIDKQGNPLSDSDDRKSAGAFGAQLIFTANEQALFKKWATPSETVDVDTVESVSIDQPISAFVIFSGCKPDAANLCNVSMRFRVIQPDGKVYAETPAMEVWRCKPAPPGRSVELSVQYLKLVVEPHELRGRYTVQTQVRDDNTDTVLFLQKTFTATESPVRKHDAAPQEMLRDKAPQYP
ncbi:MAG: hypothetical protein LBD10_11685 [Desulfobulbus sp.]|uniref:hypothetical protein n=1 Tax=Desulfobulbus sp. TaxID=895 RepID=UPI002849D61D|nr:hypothetical protein [Desulfobulbus sp.]MDR2550847.1 hypothetical protein [Desulfobulbus sp.]